MELNALDINPVVKDQSESAILGGFGGTLAPDFQEVFVHKSEVDQATAIVEKITKELYPNDAEEMLKMFPHETTEEVHRSALDLASIRFIGLGAWKWFDLHRKNSIENKSF